MQKKLLSCLAIVLTLVLLLPTVLTSCASVADMIATAEETDSRDPSADNGINTNPQQLQIFNTGLTLTQEQTMSQIKAEYLLENDGYRDDDLIVAIVELSQPSLIDLYLEDDRGMSLAEFAVSDEGKQKSAELAEAQDALIAELLEKGLIEGVEDRYTTILNGVAVTTRYGNFASLGEISAITRTILSDTYNRPQESKSTDASAIINDVDIYPTGIFNPGSVEYTGKGTAVAILDSGFDCDHSVFSTMPAGTLLITQQDVAKMLSGSNADQLGGGVDLMDVYVNAKIPFAFDYADKDTDVYPYDSEHGTHVSGIIGGKDDTITGIAVDTQLVLMKVFPDLDDGGKTEDILAALEDAVLLGVDAINMSLGSSCGFAREVDGSAINAVYDKINESGISLITAASNSYSSAYGGEQGNTGKVTNPDTGTVGSPSTYDAALSVASISGTKSRYLVGNGNQVVFFNESNSIAGDQNNFYDELRDSLKTLAETDEKYRQMYDDFVAGKSITLEYVTVPGVGMRANYTGLDVKGKIALVRRGDTTFEDKALQAKNAGAIACIIYNNIEGDILMSMGKTDHIPTISISKQAGTALAEKETGSFVLNYSQQAGPFMSDFSSWGPTPSLGLKPEITAHGGNILSAIPGGGYDEMSGTSMACPNLCGIVVLIRQYLKEQYPDCTMKQISVMCNQMLMSTATIILNEDGNPYSPRKQGAGLASLYNVVNTGAYLTVNGIDRAKLELGDDPDRTGVYTMTFNICNISDRNLSYELGIIGMTESVSTSDDTFVAEKDQILGGSIKATVGEGGSISGNTVTVQAGKTVSVTVVYTLSDADKQMIDKLFDYGMYVEGFVTLSAIGEDEISLNIPFLAFYGDWTEAPMFDKTYYEVEKEAHDASIDDEDKLKADYYATTPYGSYYYNYIIPLGTYLYDIDTSAYDEIPASTDHIAVSDYLGTIDGISAVYAGLLRNAKTMTYTITDKVTGEVVKELVVDNARKAYSYGSSPVPNYEYLRWKSEELGLQNNHQYTFTMAGKLDYGDGGTTTNVRNSFSFDFYVDNEAPVLKSVSYEKVYDKNLKKDRYYMTMVIYDNHYVQSITPIAFTSASSYAFLTEHPIPVYSEPGADNSVRFEITDYLDELYADGLITSALAFSIDDYALNSNIYVCQLPGTKGDFSFTKDGTVEGEQLSILSMYEDEIIDLTQYLATSDETVDEDKDYLKYLIWTSSNEKVVTVQEGQVRGIAPGRATITVEEGMDLKQAVLIINVKARPTEETDTQAEDAQAHSGGGAVPEGSYAAMMQRSPGDVDSASGATISSIRFDYFDTLFAYSRAAQTSEIGDTGDRVYISSLPNGGISLYPGEKIQLFYKITPWYVEDKYEVTFSSDNEESVIVDQDGVMTALKKGSANISVKVSNSNIMAYVRVTVKSEFVIDDSRTLVAYKGLGGDVVIPDDEGILYIGAYAFCLYDTDRSIELTEEDYDANKIPNANTTVTSVTIPAGVKEIQKYAFYNCSGLRSVTIPDSVKYIREYAFCKDSSLTEINLENVEVVGAYAFSGCSSLETADFSKLYAIGRRGFENCTSLTFADLSKLRNTGAEAFRGCTSLEGVVLAEKTKLSVGMFAKSGLVSVDLYTTMDIPRYCFAQCENLKTVNLYGDIYQIGYGAFCQNDALETVNFFGTVDVIGEQAFYDCNNLKAITLPDCTVTLGNYCFFDCDALETVTFGKDTVIGEVQGSIFEATALKNFVIPAGNTAYRVSGDLLTNAAGDTIVFGLTGKLSGDLVIGEDILVIAPGAFAGAGITSLTLTNPKTVISDYAFANCDALTTVNLAANTTAPIGKHAFNYCSALTEVNGLEAVKKVGDYAFANTGLQSVTVGSDAEYGEGAFFQSKLVTVTIGENTRFGLGAFQKCSYLATVNMPAGGGVHFGNACFAYDISLSNIDLSRTDDTIEPQTFYGCSKLTVANLQNVKYIGDYAFADCSALYSITFPQVISIGEGAFARYDENGGAPTVSYLTFPDTLTTMGDGAFIGCEGLLEVTLPASLTEYGDYLFAYCLNLTTVTLPSNMTRVGKYSFAGCASLTSINLQNVREIDEYAFASCELLSNLNRGSGTSGIALPVAETIGTAAFAGTALSGDLSAPKLTKVGDYAFQNADILSVNAPVLTEIGMAAFQNNAGLKEFVFNADVTQIGTMAFQGCTSLESFYVRTDSGKLADYSNGGYLILVDGVLYTAMKSGKIQLSSVPAGKDTDTLEVAENTYRIDLYAGNANPYIKKIILPSSMKLIGNYAFYGYTSLDTVEFRSFTAPAWENSYNSDAALEEKDPGYELLHNQFDLFGLELCYYNFIDLLGKTEPIHMILPSNPDAAGYDALHYLVTFGAVADAERSDYVAMEKNLSDFIEYAEQISKITTVTLGDEDLINKAVTAMNALKQSATDFGYTEEEWNAMLATVTGAKAALTALKLANASQAARDIQAKVDALPDVYSSEYRSAMAEIEALLAALPVSERSVLTLTKYNDLLSAYRADPGNSGEIETGTETETETSNTSDPGASGNTTGTQAWIIVLIVLAAVLLIAGAVIAVLIVMKNKKGGITKQ